MNTSAMVELIYREIQHMPAADMAQVVQFIRFLQSLKARPGLEKTSRTEAIDRVFGSYAGNLSSSGAFARRKQDEMAQEEAKWQRR